jgi:neurofibromin 1
MGYHEDHDTRSAFLKVLSNILNQGAEFDAVNEDTEDKYDNLMALVLDTDLKVRSRSDFDRFFHSLVLFQLILALSDATPITEADDVAQLLVRLFDASGQAVPLLKALVQQEVHKTESANTLFRRNSMATKAQAAYAKLIGNQYLKETFALLLNELLSQNISFELDPQKLTAGEDLAKNLENVKSISTRYLTVIKEHIPACPLPFRDICNFIRSIVLAKYPENALTAVGGFIFLRFLCPAIVSPDGFGILPSLPNPQLRRGLLLITKVRQSSWFSVL